MSDQVTPLKLGSIERLQGDSAESPRLSPRLKKIWPPKSPTEGKTPLTPRSLGRVWPPAREDSPASSPRFRNSPVTANNPFEPKPILSEEKPFESVPNSELREAFDKIKKKSLEETIEEETKYESIDDEPLTRVQDTNTEEIIEEEKIEEEKPEKKPKIKKAAKVLGLSEVPLEKEDAPIIANASTSLLGSKTAPVYYRGEESENDLDELYLANNRSLYLVDSWHAINFIVATVMLCLSFILAFSSIIAMASVAFDESPIILLCFGIFILLLNMVRSLVVIVTSHGRRSAPTQWKVLIADLILCIACIIVDISFYFATMGVFISQSVAGNDGIVYLSAYFTTLGLFIILLTLSIITVVRRVWKMKPELMP
jgi:hypothetical protein